MVVLGESNAYGMVATDPQNEWVQVVAALIRRYQDGYLRVQNNSIPSNVISPESLGYRPFTGLYATAPSALERYQADVIAAQPDLAIFAYGLNDARGGTPVETFTRDYRTIVTTTQSALPAALIVLVGPYWNPQFDRELWADSRYDERRRSFGKFARSGDDLVLAYNEALRRLAQETGALYVDLYPKLEGSLWLIHEDACHYTDVGQAVIGMEVFAQMAESCSFLSVKSRGAYADGGFGIWDTGGTNAMPSVIDTWRRSRSDLGRAFPNDNDARDQSDSKPQVQS
jgi:lysophospholipase L1-like esterase